MKNTIAIQKQFFYCFFLVSLLSHQACVKIDATSKSTKSLQENEQREIINKYRENPKDIEKDYTLLITVGNSFSAIGEYDEALTLFEKALNLDSKLPQAYSNKCLALIEKKMLDEAIYSCNMAIQIDSTYAGAYLNRSYAKIRQSNFEQALIDVDKSITLGFPKKIDLAQAFANKSTALLNLGKFEDAIEFATKSIENNPELLTGFKVRAIASFMKGKIDTGLADVEYGLKIKPNDTDLLYYKGLIWVKLNKKEAGCELITQAIQMNNSTADSSQYKMTKTFERYCK